MSSSDNSDYFSFKLFQISFYGVWGKKNQTNNFIHAIKHMLKFKCRISNVSRTLKAL